MRPTFLILTLAALLLAAAAPAQAHVTKTAGDHTVKVGWGAEPAASGSRNLVTVQVWTTDTEEGVSGLVGNITATVTHAGQSKELDLEESDEEPGNYSAPILPTEAGLYAVHVGGTIGTTPVSLDFAIEDVQDGDAAAFPVKNDSSAALAQKVTSLEARVSALEAKASTQSSTPVATTGQTASKGTPAVGIAVALVAVAAIALALRRRG